MGCGEGLLRDLPNHAAGIACREYLLGNVARNDAARTDHRPGPYLHAREDDRASAHPDVRADLDRSHRPDRTISD